MDNLFSLDRKSEEIIDQKVFNFQRSDADLVCGSAEESRQIEKERKIPFIVKSYYWVFSIGAFIGICLFGDGLLKYMANYTAEAEKLSRAICLVFMIVGLILFLGSIVYLIVGLKKKKEYANTDHNKQVDKKQEVSEDELKKKMGVPDSAPCIDTLFSVLKSKENGDSKQVKVYSVNYLNYPTWIWVDHNTCYLVNYFCRFEIPMENITGFTMVHKKARLAFWNKNEQPNVYTKGPNLARIKGSFIQIDKYYSLNINLLDYKYVVLVPGYDAELAKKTLGIKASNSIKEA